MVTLTSSDKQWVLSLVKDDWIGRGGNAVVYRATQQRTARGSIAPLDQTDSFVGKVFFEGSPSETVSADAARRNFEEEEKTAAALRLRDGTCVKYFNCSLASWSQQVGGKDYHVIIYRRGTPLKDILEGLKIKASWNRFDPAWWYDEGVVSAATATDTRQKLTPAKQASFVSSLFSILAYLRDNGIVHLDIKPDNLLVLNDNSLLLSDVATVCRTPAASTEGSFKDLATCASKMHRDLHPVRTTAFLMPAPLFRDKQIRDKRALRRAQGLPADSTVMLEWIDAFSIATCVYVIVTGHYWNQMGPNPTDDDPVWNEFPAIPGLSGQAVAAIVRNILTATNYADALEAADSIKTMRKTPTPRPRSVVGRPKSRAGLTPTPRADEPGRFTPIEPAPLPLPPKPESETQEDDEVRRMIGSSEDGSDVVVLSDEDEDEEEAAEKLEEDDMDIPELILDGIEDAEEIEINDRDEAEVDQLDEVDLSYFLPMYPLLDKPVSSGIRPYPGQKLEQVIYDKREFRQDGSVFRAQTIIPRFLSAHTPYRGLLVYHEMGTGKTRTAGAIADELRSSGLFKQAIVLVASSEKIADFSAKLYRDSGSSLSSKEYLSFFRFYTYREFARVIGGSGESVVKDYEGSLIIVDEVHTITSNEVVSAGKKIEIWQSRRRPASLQAAYNNLLRLVRKLQLCKLVLMSGTPMTDQYTEFRKVLNLLLPQSKHIATDADFTALLDNGGLQPLLRGRVSYLRFPMDKRVQRHFNGTEIADGCTVFETEMSPYQTQVMNSVMGGEDSTAMQLKNEASLFAFPNGTGAGDAAFASFMRSVDRSPELVKLDGDLKKYSCKYAALLQDLRDNKGQNTFAYINVVQNAGISTLKRVLAHNGWSEYGGRAESNQYAVVTGETKKTRVRNILAAFNSPENKNGSRIRLLIGSKVLSEGYDLMNVQRVHVITPFWNFTQIDQAIGRAFRVNSHKALLDAMPEGETLTVQLFMHAAIPLQGQSFDLREYTVAQGKDVNIKRVEYLCKVTAFDCELNRDRNTLPDEYEDTRLCQYEPCEYQCYGIESLDNGVDDRSFLALYADSAVQRVKKIALDMLRQHGRLSLDDVQGRVADKTEPLRGASLRMVVIRALQELVSSLTPIVNRNGIPLYLQERDRIYYLTDRITHSGPLEAAYFESPLTVQRTSLSTLVKESILPTAALRVADTIIQEHGRAGANKEDVLASALQTITSMPNAAIRNEFIRLAVERVKGPVPKESDRTLAAHLLRHVGRDKTVLQVVDGMAVVAGERYDGKEWSPFEASATEDAQRLKDTVLAKFNAMDQADREALLREFSKGPVYGKDYTNKFHLATVYLDTSKPVPATREKGTAIDSIGVPKLQAILKTYFNVSMTGSKKQLGEEVERRLKEAGLVVYYQYPSTDVAKPAK